jgi:hypothetical protein
VELPGDVVESQTNYTGTLYPMTSEFQNQIISDVENDSPDMKGVFLPFYLSVSDASDFSWNPGALALIIAVVGSVIGLVVVILRVVQPKRHPIMKRLARYGTDTDQLLQTIDADMRGDTGQLGKVTVSPHWIVYGKGGAFNVMKVSDVAWMYMQVVTRRTYGITVGKTYSAFLWDTYGVSLQTMDKEDRVREILGGISQRAPWATMGYSADLQKSWNKDRATFIKQVLERRSQYRQD